MTIPKSLRLKECLLLVGLLFCSSQFVVGNPPIVEPPTITAITGSQTVCISSNATLQVWATGTGPMTVTWKKGSTSICTCNPLTLTDVTADDAGTYTAIVSNLGGSDNDSTTVTVAVGGGPHTNSWTCLQEGSIVDTGDLSWTNRYFCLGSTITPPQLTGFSTSDGKKSRLIYYDCPWALYTNYFETNLVFYTPSLYFSPPLPSTASSVGTNVYDAYVKGMPDSACLELSGVLVATVTIRVMDTSGDTEPDYLPDCWELQYFWDLTHGPNEDYDGDTLNNRLEYVHGYDPTHFDHFPDDDGDGLPDFLDAAPTVADTSIPGFDVTSPTEGTVF